jgi:hypothetical protein
LQAREISKDAQQNYVLENMFLDNSGRSLIHVIQHGLLPTRGHSIISEENMLGIIAYS